MVGRPREFDTDKAIEDVRNAFWARGVHATSMSDLTGATGLSTGSIYKAFGSKQALIRAALAGYLEDQSDKFETALADPDPVAGIRRVFALIVEAASQPGGQRGCFATNCSIDLADTDVEAAAMLQAHNERLGAALTGTIERAVDAGAIATPALSAADISANLWMVVTGIQVAARIGITAEAASHLLDSAARTTLGIAFTP